MYELADHVNSCPSSVYTSLGPAVAYLETHTKKEEEIEIGQDNYYLVQPYVATAYNDARQDGRGDTSNIQHP